ncbi:pilin [Psychrobacter alimentarius]|uniref:pilin n=1 Tax=Psychrobacter alimentarius TaxID=261164 RepID=UPI003FD27E23
MKSRQPAVQNSHLHCRLSAQSGYTLIELMITIAIIGILSAIGVFSYQTQLRQANIITIYQESNLFRLPYQTLLNEGAGVTSFSPDGLNIPSTSEYCEFSITAPNMNGITINAVVCEIQGLSYLQDQSVSLDRAADGSWQCRPSAGIPKSYLPKDCQ